MVQTAEELSDEVAYGPLGLNDEFATIENFIENRIQAYVAILPKWAETQVYLPQFSIFAKKPIGVGGYSCNVLFEASLTASSCQLVEHQTDMQLSCNQTKRDLVLSPRK